MLEKLFTSRSRSKIITLFMLNPNEDMYVREITNKVQENINSVRRELSNLEDMGLLVSRKRVILNITVLTRIFLFIQSFTAWL